MCKKAHSQVKVYPILVYFAIIIYREYTRTMGDPLKPQAGKRRFKAFRNNVYLILVPHIFIPRAAGFLLRFRLKRNIPDNECAARQKQCKQLPPKRFLLRVCQGMMAL